MVSLSQRGTNLDRQKRDSLTTLLRFAGGCLVTAALFVGLALLDDPGALLQLAAFGSCCACIHLAVSYFAQLQEESSGLANQSLGAMRSPAFCSENAVVELPASSLFHTLSLRVKRTSSAGGA